MREEPKRKKSHQFLQDCERGILEQFPLLIPFWNFVKRELWGVKQGWILFLILALIPLWGGYSIGRQKHDSEFSTLEERIQTVEKYNRSLRQERSDLRSERDKFELKLAMYETRANVPVQSNSPPDKRLELLLDKVESLAKDFPQNPKFELFINDVIVQSGTAVRLDQSRTFRIGVRNLSETTAENVIVNFMSELHETNVIAKDWIAGGQGGIFTNQQFKSLGTPAWMTKDQNSLGGGQLWSTWPVTILTNWNRPFFSSIGIHSDRSKYHNFNVIFVFSP